MKFVIWLLINALGVGAAVWLFEDISLAGADTRTDQALTLLVVGLILGVVNSVVRPVVNLLSLPLIVLTLGLMLFVTNALMLALTSKIADGLDLHFHVAGGFWTYVLGSVVISIASIIAAALLPDPD